ncbi:amino acid adenylation domain-containing protein [Streptomyces sp. NPDC046727]|uniref:non-ribosomal peptide synthetase n=1 Tax=Streptomyces sp. NPDC046727 TaxID=3155373 RepID=UPI0033C57F68
MNGSQTPEAAFPASFAQRRLWFIEQLVPGTAQHNLGLQYRVTGTVDPDALAWAVNQVVIRHEALRTRFGTIDGTPVQVVRAESPVNVATVAVPDDAGIEAAVSSLVREPFDIARLPLLRVALVQGPTRTVLLFVMHHIIADAWSLGIFADEVAHLYQEHLEGATSAPEQLPLQYVDFALWQQEHAESAEYADARRAYADSLRGAPQLLGLPTDRSRPPVQTFAGDSLEFTIPGDTVRRLKAVADTTDATLYMALLACYYIVLARLTGQQDLLVASPVAGRTRAETEPLIGFFANTLVLRLDVSGTPSFRELLGQVRESCLTAFSGQDVAFEHLVEDLAPERNLNHNPLAQVMFILQNAPSQSLRLPGADLEPVEIDTATSQFDLTLNLTPEDEGLAALLQFSSELFDRSTIERFAGYFTAVLEAVAADPAAAVVSLEMLDDAERSRLMALGTGPAPRQDLEMVPDRIRRMAHDRPHQVAVVSGDRRWTYAELIRHADAVTEALGERNVTPGELVGICLPRSGDMVSALLGVWRAGAAYVPLDPEYPQDRLAFMSEDSALRVVLTTRALADRVPVGDAVRLVFVEDLSHGPHRASTPAATAPDALAYVIHTSGSTGKPKGVMIEQQNLANVVHSFMDRPGFGPQDRMLALTSLSFDIAGLELFTPLAAGGLLVIGGSGVAGDPQLLDELIRQHDITVVQATPSTWQAYCGYTAAAPASLRQIWCGGEEMSGALAGRLTGLGARVHNVYGPTETTIWSTCTEVTADAEPAIGTPIAGTRLFVLDGAGRQVPIGVPGELWIAGSGVGRGYLRRPELTAERFGTAPDGTRAYRTGDLVRWSPDGSLRFLGRMDHQVKFHGHRIELGEIDATMRAHPQVRDSLTLVRRRTGAESQLVTFLIPETCTEVDAGPPVEAWRGVWDEIYGQGEAPSQGDLNLKGWQSSYTKQPLPADEMRHWVENTVASIAATDARTYCEIGCGTGMLLLRLAPDSERYVGIDLSKEAIHHVDREVESRGLSDRVELVVGSADDLAAVAGGRRFDCVIINSVAQYFPSEDYLTRTLSAACKVVSPGGFVFVGDLRHRGLAEAFHASVLDQYGLPQEQIRTQAPHRALEEEELLVDPGYFAKLRSVEPSITGVQVSLKPAGPDNELTRFRYDVLLQVDGPDHPGVPDTVLDWATEVGSLRRLEEVLGAAEEDFVVDGIPNARVARFVDLLKPAEASGPDSGGRAPVAVEDLSAIADTHGWQIHHDWSPGHGSEGRVRATFRRRAPRGEVLQPFHDSKPTAVEPVTNHPAAAAIMRSLPLAARTWARRTLPDYMVPQLLRVLPTMPLTPNGKADRNALHAMMTNQGPSPAAAPLDGEAQRRLHAIWCEVLGVAQVSPTENFFDVGGTSMSIVRVRQELRSRHGIDVPMATFFAHPTIEALAAHLADQENPERNGQSGTAGQGTQRRRGPAAAAQRRRAGRQAGA